MTSAYTLLGIVAVLLSSVALLPQAVTALRSDDVSGISATGAALAAVSYAGWLWYSIALALSASVVLSVIGTVAWSVIAVTTLLRRGVRPPWWVAAWAAVLMAAAVVGGPAILGTVLLGEALSATVPQAWRARRSTAGVSTGTYLLMFAGSCCWAVYAGIARDLPLAVSGGVKAAVCLYIVALLCRRRAHPPAHLQAPASAL